MKLKVRRLMDGPGPGEAMVEVVAANGMFEEVIVSDTSIVEDGIEIGQPISFENDAALVELPMESMSGRWRIWVRRADVRETRE